MLFRLSKIVTTFCSVILIAAACFITSCSGAYKSERYVLSSACVETTIDDLWRNPKQFSGRRVCMSGFFGRIVPYGEDSPKIYATEIDAQATKLERFATLGIPFAIATQERLSKYSAKEVRVVGILKLENPCLSEPTPGISDSLCSPPPALRIAKARLTFADGTQFP